jgi:mRNA degradation ribonuclease J1/J2
MEGYRHHRHGVQFPEEDMPGIDYIVPNVSYLKGKEKNIRGVLFTHGHLDHIGAAPILLKQLNYPTIIGRDFTLALIKHKCEDQEKGAANRLKAVRVKSLADRIKLGSVRESVSLKWNTRSWMLWASPS